MKSVIRKRKKISWCHCSDLDTILILAIFLYSNLHVLTNEVCVPVRDTTQLATVMSHDIGYYHNEHPKLSFAKT